MEAHLHAYCLLHLTVVPTWLTWGGKCSPSMSSGSLGKGSIHRWIPLFTLVGRWQTDGELFANVNVVTRVHHGGSDIMVWGDIVYEQSTQCRDNMTRSWGHVIHPPPSPSVAPWCAQTHITRIRTQFLEAQNIQVLAWPAYSTDMSTIEHVWDALDRCIRQLYRPSIKKNCTLQSGLLLWPA